jgi:hypothetical protein
MHAALMVNELRQSFDSRQLLFYATPALNPGRDIQLLPGNFPKPPQAKRCFSKGGGGLS